MTAKIGHFMVLSGSNRLASLKLKPIKLKAHNENQRKVSNFINKDWKFEFKKVLKLKC